MGRALHTSDGRRAKRIWILLGGQMIPVRRTGEMRYSHPAFCATVRANDRRNDVPAVLLNRINQLLKTKAANDPIWEVVR
ncbi:MAG: hypothetical protein FWD67_04345 [Betaproteobacteria bacterium]|nr:hypothetical protein [Betaproteobacteria bacterium]